MRSRKRPGMSLMLVMVLVSVMAFLSAAMTGLFLMNLNFTQGTFNQEIALGQAEAGVSQVLYHLGLDDEATYGRDQSQELSGSISKDMRADESFYHVTFKPGPAPYSTNNVDGSHATGYLGRTIPKGCVHVLSKGVARGQVRLIECIVVKPQCPYGLATSGPIVSLSPLTVVGASSAQSYIDGKADRPGHIVSNSAQGITINAKPGKQTEISGFAKSVGNITIDQPADVKGGTRANSSSSALPHIDLTQFDPQKTGMTGFVEVREGEQPGQQLDIMYYCSHPLTYNGPIQMNNAFVFVKGDLIIHGGISGVGAIVATGNITVAGGASLQGQNQVALLAGGKITLRGNGAGNFFQGLLYSQTGLDASNLGIVGTAVVDSADPKSGTAQLDEVTFVSEQTKGAINFTVDTYGSLKYQLPGKQNPADGLQFWDPNRTFDSNGNPLNPPGGWVVPDPTNRDQLTKSLVGSGSVELYGKLAGMNSGGTATLNFVTMPGYSGPSTLGMEIPMRGIQAKYTEYALIDPQIQQLESDKKGLVSPADDAEIRSIDSQIAELQAKKTQLLADMNALYAQYTAAAQAYVDAFWTWNDQTASGTGKNRLRPGSKPPDIHRQFVFDVNKYMPKSDRMQVSFWRVTSSHF